MKLNRLMASMLVATSLSVFAQASKTDPVAAPVLAAPTAASKTTSPITVSAVDPYAVEYSAGRFLDPIKAKSAWGRGYTGKGSTILIIDTGINTKSPEFAGRIKGTIDYTRTSVEDTNGHGSNVAGIAAAARNATGMTGVAYDANLLIAKVATGTSYDFNSALKAIQWGAQNGAIVANISANEVSNADYNRYSTLIAPGVYKNTHPYYGGANYYNMATPAGLQSAMANNNIVLVVSAGNAGRMYPDNPATFATATDSKGNLVLGGRMLIVGAYDPNTGTIASFSNRAGTVCKNVVGSVCKDAYRTSDFYIMAPGVNDYSVGYGAANAYSVYSGTSQAAPSVTGAVAIINQMWPNMKPENIAKLLLQTANKNIKGYDVNTMGQGLLDLDRATQPVGALNLPTTGRINKTYNATVPTLISSGTAKIGTISNVMVVDSYNRDFYTNVKPATVAAVNPAGINPLQAVLPYTTQNNYSQLNAYSYANGFKIGDNDVRMFLSGPTGNPMLEVGHTKHYDAVDVRYAVGSFGETGTWLGNQSASLNNTVSATTYGSVGVSARLVDDQRVYSNFSYGFTRTNYNDGMVAGLNTVQSASWLVGYEKAMDLHQTVGIMLNQPTSVVRGTANVVAPNGFAADGETANWATQRVSLTPDVREYRVGTYYRYTDRSKLSNTSLTAFAEQRYNYMAQQGVKNTVVGFALDQRF